MAKQDRFRVVLKACAYLPTVVRVQSASLVNQLLVQLFGIIQKHKYINTYYLQSPAIDQELTWIRQIPQTPIKNINNSMLKANQQGSTQLYHIQCNILHQTNQDTQTLSLNQHKSARYHRYITIHVEITPFNYHKD
jgi:hypothetical protein